MSWSIRNCFMKDPEFTYKKLCVCPRTFRRPSPSQSPCGTARPWGRLPTAPIGLGTLGPGGQLPFPPFHSGETCPSEHFCHPGSPEACPRADRGSREGGQGAVVAQGPVVCGPHLGRFFCTAGGNLSTSGSKLWLTI